MLTTIGRRSKPPGDIVDHLLECHGRIRHFIRLACDIGDAAALGGAEVCDACARCDRYFVQALPLHVQDEEESLWPRLRAHDDVAHALLAASQQHGEHEPLVAALLEALRRVGADPVSPPLRETLARAAEELSRAMEPHLALEESLLFPALRAKLDFQASEDVRLEMQLRRALR